MFEGGWTQSVLRLVTGGVIIKECGLHIAISLPNASRGEAPLGGPPPQAGPGEAPACPESESYVTEQPQIDDGSDPLGEASSLWELF